MRKTTRANVELELLLQRMNDELQHLPRHEWDGYLWSLCRTLVGDEAKRPAAEPPPAKSDSNF